MHVIERNARLVHTDDKFTPLNPIMNIAALLVDGYISLIQTSLLYGSNTFSPCLPITHVNRLITISKRAQRISFGYPPSARTTPIRVRHKLIPLDSLLLFKRLVVVFRSLHSVGSCLLDSLFSFRCNSNRTSTVTRVHVTKCLALPDVRTRSALKSLGYTATK